MTTFDRVLVSLWCSAMFIALASIDVRLAMLRPCLCVNPDAVPVPTPKPPRRPLWPIVAEVNP